MRSVLVSMRNSFLPATCDAAPAEEIDAGTRNRLAGAGVGDKVIDFAIERFFHDDRIVEPDHDAADVATFHLAVSR